jgi:hypothetical protein
MHPNTARVLQIQYYVEWMLSPERMLADPYLVSVVSRYGGVPLATLCRMGPFIKLTVAPEELLEACRHSREIDLSAHGSLDALIQLPYQVNPKCLLVRQIPDVNMTGLINFVRRISGDHEFLFYPIPNVDRWALAFPTAELSIAFWRATPYCRFEGHQLEISAFSQNWGMSVPRPIVVETRAPPVRVSARRLSSEAWDVEDNAAMRKRRAELILGTKVTSTSARVSVHGGPPLVMPP